MCDQSLSHVWLFATPWTVAHQVPLSMEFTDQDTGVGCHSLLQNTQLEMPNGSQEVGLALRSLLSLKMSGRTCLLRECIFPLAAITNHHKPIGSKQCIFIILQFWMSAIWKKLSWAAVDVSAGLPPCWWLQRSVCLRVYSGSGGCPSSSAHGPSSIFTPSR